MLGHQFAAKLPVMRMAVVVLAITMAVALAACAAGPPGAVRILEVTDGDTIRAVVSGREESIRLIGIDTPELRPRPEPLAQVAREYVVRLVQGKWVWLEYDQNQRDRFGRLLAYVWLSNHSAAQPATAKTDMLNARLLLAGLAEVLTITPNDKHAALFRSLQADAVSARRGKWRGKD